MVIRGKHLVTGRDSHFTKQYDGPIEKLTLESRSLLMVEE